MRPVFMLFALLLAAQTLTASAQERAVPEYSAELEAEAREVGKSLRCVVCQNQSIEDSAAPLAADMRQLVRERLAAGDTPKQVRAFMTTRYGNFVLMKPPFQPDTLLLWLGPGLFLLLASTGWFIYLKPRAQAPGSPEDLTAEEELRLSRHLSDGAGS